METLTKITLTEDLLIMTVDEVLKNESEDDKMLRALTEKEATNFILSKGISLQKEKDGMIRIFFNNTKDIDSISRIESIDVVNLVWSKALEQYNKNKN